MKAPRVTVRLLALKGPFVRALCAVVGSFFPRPPRNTMSFPYFFEIARGNHGSGEVIESMGPLDPSSTLLRSGEFRMEGCVSWG